MATLAGAAAFAPVGTAMAAGSSGAAAFGLIIGLKVDAETEADDIRQASRGPWASDREQDRARWNRSSRQGRERVARLAKEAGVSYRSAGEAGNAQLLRFERPMKGDALKNVLRRARLHPDVAWVEPDVLVPRSQAVLPNDDLFPDQWHLQDPLVGFRSAMNLPLAWGQTTGSAGVVVAVVDSGVRLDHPDLAGTLLPGYDMVSEIDIANDLDGRDADPSDPGDWVSFAEAGQGVFAGCDPAWSSWHGTFIAGQIAAATHNNLGVAGINWAARVLPVRVSGKCGALISDLLDGIRWAAGLPVGSLPPPAQAARIINLSFGGDTACTPAYQSTIDAVTGAGALVVVSAGNNSTALTRPADCQGVMAVTAVRRDGAKAGYSSFGPQVALSAPGGSTESWPGSALRSTDNTGLQSPVAHSYGYKVGTSFAAPQAVGVASLMLAVNPALTPSQLIERMKAGARPHEDAGFAACSGANSGVCNCTTTTCGAGLLDAHLSVQLAANPAAVIVPIGTVTPGSTITLDGSNSRAIPGSNITAYRWEPVGAPALGVVPDNLSVVSVVLPAAEASYVFRLTVTDDAGRSGQDTVQVVVANPATGGGGGSMGQLWGLSLWAWVLAVLASQRRRRRG